MNVSEKNPAASAVAIVIIVLLLLSIASMVTPLLLQISGVTSVNSSVFFINRLFVWLVLLILWLYVKYFEKQPLLIWAERKRNVSFYILSVLIILIIVFIGNIVITKTVGLFVPNEVSKKFLLYIQILKTNIPLLIFTAFTAAVVEELIFRGFIQTRLSSMFKNPVWAILLSSLLFAVVHLSYGTFINFIGPFYIGIIFSYFYWKYRNIKVLIICHFLWDLLGLFVSIKAH